jgi:hypothetical protein
MQAIEQRIPYIRDEGQSTIARAFGSLVKKVGRLTGTYKPSLLRDISDMRMPGREYVVIPHSPDSFLPPKPKREFKQAVTVEDIYFQENTVKALHNQLIDLNNARLHKYTTDGNVPGGREYIIGFTDLNRAYQDARALLTDMRNQYTRDNYGNMPPARESGRRQIIDNIMENVG